MSSRREAVGQRLGGDVGDEHGAGLAQVGRRLGARRQGAELGDVVEPVRQRLLLEERTRARAADAVHVGLEHAPVAHVDELGVLAADLDDRQAAAAVCVEAHGGRGVGHDLVQHREPLAEGGIGGTHDGRHGVAPGAGQADGRHVVVRPRRPQVGDEPLGRLDRVAVGAPVDVGQHGAGGGSTSTPFEPVEPRSRPSTTVPGPPARAPLVASVAARAFAARPAECADAARASAPRRDRLRRAARPSPDRRPRAAARARGRDAPRRGPPAVPARRRRPTTARPPPAARRAPRTRRPAARPRRVPTRARETTRPADRSARRGRPAPPVRRPWRGRTGRARCAPRSRTARETGGRGPRPGWRSGSARSWQTRRSAR